MEMYVYKNDVLIYQRVNLATGEVERVKELGKLDVFDGYQKGEFFILTKYKDNSQITYIYKNGHLLKELNISVTEFQVSSMDKSVNAVVIDSTDLSQLNENYTNKLLVYLVDKDSLGRIVLSSNKVQSVNNIGNIRYIFYPFSYPQDPSSKHWSYVLQLMDLETKQVLKFDTIQQSNFNIRDGLWEFIPSYSFWKSTNEVTYLLYKPYEEKIRIKIMGFKIDVGKKEELFNFEIPNEVQTVDLKYWIENNTVYLSNGGVLYKVKDNKLTTIYKSEGTIEGFTF